MNFSLSITNAFYSILYIKVSIYPIYSSIYSSLCLCVRHFALNLLAFPQLDYCQLHCSWQKEKETKLAVERDKPSAVLHLLPPAAAASDSRANLPFLQLIFLCPYDNLHRTVV